MVGAMRVRLVRPSPIVLVHVSVSIGRNGKMKLPAMGPISLLISIADKSTLNLLMSTFCLPAGSSSLTFVAFEVCFFMRGSAFQNSEVHKITVNAKTGNIPANQSNSHRSAYDSRKPLDSGYNVEFHVNWHPIHNSTGRTSAQPERCRR